MHVDIVEVAPLYIGYKNSSCISKLNVKIIIGCVIVILSEECNNIIVVYLLLPWQQLPYFTFFNIFVNFFSVFHGLFSFFICNNYYKKYIKDSYTYKKYFKCARVTTSNFHISQTFSCISKFFLHFILYFIGLNCHYIYMNVIVTDIISY